MLTGMSPGSHPRQSTYPDDPDDDADPDDHPGSAPPHPALFESGSGPAHHQGRYQTAPPHGLIGVCCPHCGSARTTPSHLGRRIGSAIGTLAGAATATARTAGGAQLGAQWGAVVGSSAGPAGTTLGVIAGAVLGAMVGAAAGCAVGAALGEAIDAKILHNRHCRHCGRGFSVETT